VPAVYHVQVTGMASYCTPLWCNHSTVHLVRKK